MLIVEPLHSDKQSEPPIQFNMTCFTSSPVHNWSNYHLNQKSHAENPDCVFQIRNETILSYPSAASAKVITVATLDGWQKGASSYLLFRLQTSVSLSFIPPLLIPAAALVNVCTERNSRRINYTLWCSLSSVQAEVHVWMERSASICLMEQKSHYHIEAEKHPLSPDTHVQKEIEQREKHANCGFNV